MIDQRRGTETRNAIDLILGRTRKLTAEKFVEIWRHYDKDDNKQLEGRELDQFLTDFIGSALFEESREKVANVSAHNLEKVKQNVLREFDGNRDGRISLGELNYLLPVQESFKVLMLLHNECKKEPNVMELWSKYDKNLTGTLEINELKDFIRDLVRPVLKAKEVDELEVDEFSRALLAVFDKNKDHKLRFSEFVSMVPTQENIVKKIVDQCGNPTMLSPGFLLTVLKNYDKNGNGYLEKDEIAHLARDVLQVTKDGQFDVNDVEPLEKTLLSHFDRDGNNKIDLRELKIILVSVLESANSRRVQ